MPDMIATPRFDARSTAAEVIAGHDLRGKVAVITGATSGIGVETARIFASAGASVVMGIRNVEKGHGVARAIARSTGHDDIAVLQLDLGDLRSVQSFAAAVIDRYPAIDVLINNAGIADVPYSFTAQGHELHFGTNHLGHFLLFELLLDRLKAAETARVVSLSSAAHRRSAINFDDLDFRIGGYDGYAAYAQSKTATSLFAVGVTDRHRGAGIVCNAVMPGMIITDLIGRASPERLRALRFTDETGAMRACVKTIEQGAATSVWAALAPELDGVGGLYLEDCAPARPWSRELMAEHPWAGVVPHALDPGDADRLWDESARRVRA